MNLFISLHRVFTMNVPMKEELEKAFAKLFPDYEAGQEYAFSHDELSSADFERYEEIGEVIEASLNDTTVVEISNKVYHFL